MVDQRLAATQGADVHPGFAISSQVLPGLMAVVDTCAIFSVALISFVLLVGSYLDEADQYITAICFVWLVTVMLMNFAGLYRLEPIMRPLAFLGKFIFSFATTVLFLLAGVFALKVSTNFSRLWMGTFTAGACAMTIVSRVIIS